MNTRYFPIKIGDKLFEIEPPKLKTLRKFENMNSNGNDTTQELSEMISEILSKNKQKYKVDVDFVEENFEIDTIFEFLHLYFKWVGKAHNDPN
jgi:hypothetical protein